MSIVSRFRKIIFSSFFSCVFLARFTQEGSPRRSLSSMARESRDDYSPFTPDSRDSGFGQNSQEELKLFNMATAMPGSLAGGSGLDRNARAYDSEGDDDDELGPSTTGLIIGDELVNPDPVS